MKKIAVLTVFLMGISFVLFAFGQKEEKPFTSVARPERFGNEPFVTVCLITESGDVYAVQSADQAKASTLDSLWYSVTLKEIPDQAPPPGITCKAVVALISIEEQ